jgi:hypothetical protein
MPTYLSYDLVSINLEAAEQVRGELLLVPGLLELPVHLGQRSAGEGGGGTRRKTTPLMAILKPPLLVKDSCMRKGSTWRWHYGIYQSPSVGI